MPSWGLLLNEYYSHVVTDEKRVSSMLTYHVRSNGPHSLKENSFP